MQVEAKITGIKYQPFMCSSLKEFHIKDFDNAIKNSYCIIKINDQNRVAISRWVSAKRTRSYPYAYVYNTLSFSGKKITIIPVFKDEGKDGDRDYLQWDTISLMSLLGIYVIIAYYKNATIKKDFKNKITNQRFEKNYIIQKINEITRYQSDALHWNLEQIEDIGKIGFLAIENYERISKDLNIEMHSIKSAKRRIEKLVESKETFINLSRSLAKKAQIRESKTIQPKESLSGNKGIISIMNYLGGYYFFTIDEVRMDKNNLYLVEAKHTDMNSLPSENDIKDGLLKMILFTNLVKVQVDNKGYKPVAVLKLSSGKGISINNLKPSQRKLLDLLKVEAKTNNFRIELL